MVLFGVFLKKSQALQPHIVVIYEVGETRHGTVRNDVFAWIG